ncbi:hypothetical protein BO99DRAFT_81218 [Aspergillus violaceofuscus CBS 115571]|uniref:Uncharacterized protein n=2 Tax=Aspergillus TaxID=5052 RepID=A0A2V5HY93_ASPV1|nr:hypothetical protein BO99DRAFT_81218 [Aspergillus violaceofuscus CBS 115571]
MSSSSMLPPVGPIGHVYSRGRRSSNSSSSQYSWIGPRPKPRGGGSRGYSTDDEDEVLYDLDEAALAQLPVHLQDIMRELQLERVHRFQQQQQQQQQQSAHNELRLARPVYYSHYAETWFKNMMARLSADQEMSDAHYHLRQTQENTYQQDRSWRSQQQQWSVNRQNDIQAAAAAMGENSTWFGDGDGDGEPVPEMAPPHQEMAVFERDVDVSPVSSRRFYSMHYGYGPRPEDRGRPLYETDTGSSSRNRRGDGKGGVQSHHQRKKTRSVINFMRCRVKRSIRRMGRLLKR